MIVELLVSRARGHKGLCLGPYKKKGPKKKSTHNSSELLTFFCNSYLIVKINRILGQLYYDYFLSPSSGAFL